MGKKEGKEGQKIIFIYIYIYKSPFYTKNKGYNFKEERSMLGKITLKGQPKHWFHIDATVLILFLNTKPSTSENLGHGSGSVVDPTSLQVLGLVYLVAGGIEVINLSNHCQANMILFVPNLH